MKFKWPWHKKKRSESSVGDVVPVGANGMEWRHLLEEMRACRSLVELTAWLWAYHDAQREIRFGEPPMGYDYRVDFEVMREAQWLVNSLHASDKAVIEEVQRRWS